LLLRSSSIFDEPAFRVAKGQIGPFLLRGGELGFEACGLVLKRPLLASHQLGVEKAVHRTRARSEDISVGGAARLVDVSFAAECLEFSSDEDWCGKFFLEKESRNQVGFLDAVEDWGKEKSGEVGECDPAPIRRKLHEVNDVMKGTGIITANLQYAVFDRAGCDLGMFELRATAPYVCEVPLQAGARVYEFVPSPRAPGADRRREFAWVGLAKGGQLCQRDFSICDLLRQAGLAFTRLG
jgi:hypothetical protein